MTSDEVKAHTGSAEDPAAVARERDQLAALLIDAEQRLAGVPQLELQVTELERQLEIARAQTRQAEQVAQQLDQMLMYGRRALRYVRPMIKPLRQARRRLRS